MQAIELTKQLKLVRWRYLGLGLLAASLLLAFIFRSAIANIPALLLLRNDYPRPGADAIILLMGDAAWRPPEAARLYAGKVATQVILTKTADPPPPLIKYERQELDIATERLREEGVPAESIIAIRSKRPVGSTIDEAVLYRKYFERAPVPPKRIVIVTSWNHTSRAKWVFQKEFASLGTKIEVSPAFNTSPIGWWENEDSFFSVFSEYVKWLYYLLNFTLRKFPDNVEITDAYTWNFRVLSR